uniref:Uncharacterized protein n=1 Tax=Rhizophora mucronata TaxID=61149 RepID=A0A2P2NT16_RHIMU
MVLLCFHFVNQLMNRLRLFTRLLYKNNPLNYKFGEHRLFIRLLFVQF